MLYHDREVNLKHLKKGVNSYKQKLKNLIFQFTESEGFIVASKYLKK